MTVIRSSLLLSGLTLLVIAPTLASHRTERSNPAPPVAQPTTRRTVDIVAERFLFVPSEIAVDMGTTLEIRLTSEDTDHGFRILDTDINVAIPKRGRGEVTVIFDAREPGDYTFECSQMCGAGHSFMRGQIRVRSGVQSSSAGVGR